MIPVNRAPQRFRVWDNHVQHMCYPWSDKHAHPFGCPYTGTSTMFFLQPEGALGITDGLSVHPFYPPTTDNLYIVPLFDTGLTTKDGRSIYEGDIISFTIDGATHGREPYHCAAAHVWWCAKDACWAFGRWVQTISTLTDQESRTYEWWYTAMDDGFNHGSLQVLGNLFESPELVASLGYIPSL